MRNIWKMRVRRMWTRVKEECGGWGDGEEGEEREGRCLAGGSSRGNAIPTWEL